MDFNESDQQLLYSVGEVAERLRVGRSTIFELLASGRLPSVRIGRRRLVTARALELFVADLEAASPPSTKTDCGGEP